MVNTIQDLEKIAEDFAGVHVNKERGVPFYIYKIRRRQPLRLIEEEERNAFIQHVNFTFINSHNLFEYFNKYKNVDVRGGYSVIRLSIENSVKKENIDIFTEGTLGISKLIKKKDLERINSAGYEIDYLGNVEVIFFGSMA